MNRIQRIKKHTRMGIAIPAALGYLILTIAVYAYMYEGAVQHFYTSFPPAFTIATTIFALIAAGLFGILVSLIVTTARELRALGLGVTGILFGSLAAGCPGCAFGLFPLLLGVFGVGGTLAIMPLKGVEFQILSVLLLLGAILLLGKEQEITCPPRETIKSRRRKG